jgi:hypothetical protein
MTDYIDNYVNNILDKYVFDYIEDKYNYEIKFNEIKNTKIKDILVSYNINSRRFDIFNYNKGQRLELFKDEFKKFTYNDDNMQTIINTHINHIITEYYKHHISILGKEYINFPFELQQTIINTNLLTKSKKHDNIIENLISRIKIQEEKTKDNIQNYILLKLKNQDNMINELNAKIKMLQKNQYNNLLYIFAGFVFCLYFKF